MKIKSLTSFHLAHLLNKCVPRFGKNVLMLDKNPGTLRTCFQCAGKYSLTIETGTVIFSEFYFPILVVGPIISSISE